MRRVALSTVLPWAWPSVARPMGGAGAVWPKAFPATTRGVCALHSGFFIYIDVMYVTMSCMQGATGSLRPNGCLCCSGMPRGGDWPVPRRVSSARRSDRSQRNSPGLNAQPGAPAHACASHGACNASECSPRLAQMRPPSQPTVTRLLKKTCDECGTGDAWQAGHDAVLGCYVPSE